MSTTTTSTSTEVCDGENLAIILALYWVVYLIINAVIFAVAMYALNRCFNGGGSPDNKKKDKNQSVDRQNSQSSRAGLISREKH
ncbi:unnamed protein product [Rotaria sordida]|uniref:Uncharacterized protein n=1 Tax=Rotaria sordida TaxID=392033 RepID=A0A814UB15_9BILA|nr:unnamed protein product [Rotaria sordida]CAF1171583.1 unnamed protein product [Rotaria sordida]CAF1382654.1 unnamed protein product [Rotaria sordida]CAF3483807.1 unnamed protein product [Rotaria sordida]CAF3559548.1 unnamed protein product [Rotaria sordida]